MELRHLRYFVAVAEEGHVTRAAERLGIQQPPLSQQIRALEAELQVQLFRRKPRGVELTHAGEALLAEAQPILRRVEHAVGAAQRAARGEAGRLALGFTSSASFHPLVPQLIRHYREAFPLVALTLEESGTGELVAALLAERIDAAFVRSPIGAAAGIAVDTLLEEPMIGVLPAGHALAAATEPLPLAALAGETFILYRRPLGPGLYDAIIAACQRAGFSPTIGQEAPRMLATLSLVAAGLGITLVPESMRRLAVTGVIYQPLHRQAGLLASLSLASRRSDTGPALRRFIALVRLARSDSPLRGTLTSGAGDPT
ncbi:MAG TPA: LysR family transcriptional regulator [Stellaceae bacterium]|nr:LysR family transcriptional regulator [Stellaceae bacterium]